MEHLILITAWNYSTACTILSVSLSPNLNNDAEQVKPVYCMVYFVQHVARDWRYLGPQWRGQKEETRTRCENYKQLIKVWPCYIGVILIECFFYDQSCSQIKTTLTWFFWKMFRMTRRKPGLSITLTISIQLEKWINDNSINK